MNIYEQCKVLSVNNLVFKAIGKIVLKNNSEWNIPHLHFMVNKSEDNIYEAVCLELSFFNSGAWHLQWQPQCPHCRSDAHALPEKAARL